MPKQASGFRHEFAIIMSLPAPGPFAITPASQHDTGSAEDGELSRLRAIVDAQTAISNAGPNLDNVMAATAAHMQALTGANGAIVELIEGDEMVYMAGCGTAAPYIGTRLKQNSSLSGYCVRTGEVIYCEDTEEDERVDRAACRRAGTRSLLVTPLMHDSKVVGVLKVISLKPHAFGESSLRTLQLMAGLVGSLLAQAREYEAKQKLLEERTQALEQLRESEERFRNSFASAVIGKALVNLKGEFLQVNKALCDLLGYHEAELLGLTLQEITHAEDFPAVKTQIEQAISGQAASYQLENRYISKSGEEVWVLYSASVVRDRDGRPSYFIAEVQDIGERKRLLASLELARDEMANLAYIDTLTGIPNRRAFDKRLKEEISACQRHGRHFSLGLFDVDKFKSFNDTYGHPAGDEVLRQVGEILSQALRPTDFVARYGGEEFVFILPETCETGSKVVAERLRKMIAAHNWQITQVTASFGIATWSGEDAQTLLVNADLALYSAKKNGRNCVVHRRQAMQIPEA